jgi:D-methionine transport system ATP-binding protein
MVAASTKTQLRLHHVGFTTQSGAPLLQDISFELAGGDRVALLGASGAGKTSLLRLLNRLSEPTQGRIELDGTDLRQLPIRQVRQQVMLVPQESKLLGMTVADALAYPLRLQGVAATAIQAQVSQCMERLHVPSDWLDRSETQLSVGQRQWVAIARALVTQPAVLLLDEPTSALDAGRANHLMQVLNSLATQHQMVIIMVNHQLDVAETFADRVLVLQQGRLITNQPATAIDWQTLKQGLIDAETEDAEEWG